MTYPANILSADEALIKDQVEIEFTDPDNQPVPGPGSALPEGWHADDSNLDANGNNLTDLGGLSVVDVFCSNEVSVDGAFDAQNTGDDLLLGFYSVSGAPVTQPQVPATPLPQDIVDALVALGLVSQAS